MKLLLSWHQFKVVAVIFSIFVTCIIVIFVSLHFFMERLLERDATMNGMRWAEQLEANTPDIEKIVAGLEEINDQIIYMDKISSSAQIYRYDFLNNKGEVTKSTGSFHPETQVLAAQHHAHSHEAVDTEISKSTPAEKKVIPNDAVKPLPHKNHDAHSNTIVELMHHNVGLHDGDNISNPASYAVVIHPIISNNIFAGAIKVYVDQTEKQLLYKNTMLMFSLILVSIAFLVFIIISYFYLFLRKKTDSAVVEAQFLAKHDVATGLLNREAFFNEVEAILQHKTPNTKHQTSLNMPCILSTWMIFKE